MPKWLASIFIWCISGLCTFILWASSVWALSADDHSSVGFYWEWTAWYSTIDLNNYQDTPLRVNNAYIAYQDAHVLTGVTLSGVTRIGIVWSGDSQERFLENVASFTGTYQYRISRKIKNIQEGQNTYTITQYNSDGKSLGQRAISLDFFDSEAFWNFLVRQVYTQDTDFSAYRVYDTFAGREEPPFYYWYPDDTPGVTPDTYMLAMDRRFGTYIMELGNGYSLVYTVSYQADTKLPQKKVAFAHTNTDGRTTFSNELLNVDLTFGPFRNASLTRYTNDVYFLEVANQDFIFSPKAMKVVNIQDLEYATIGRFAYPYYTVSIEDNKLVLTERDADKTYDPGGHQRIIYDLTTLEWVSMQRIKPINAKQIRLSSSWAAYTFNGSTTWGQATVVSTDSGFSVLLNTPPTGFIILNPEFIDRYYNSKRYLTRYDITLTDFSGTLYDNKYLYLTRLTPFHPRLSTVE